MTGGIDIVQKQIEVALGERLALTQADIGLSGHAIECRINAEDPVSFAPSAGRITRWDLPGGPGVRVDSHIACGDLVSPHYDSLIAKLVVHGADRREALQRARVALSEMTVEGISTNIALHREILQDDAFRAGGVTIHHLEQRLAQGAAR
jgi:acetyl-CoA carboxylase biotin carboxylase subunit